MTSPDFDSSDTMHRLEAIADRLKRAADPLTLEERGDILWSLRERSAEDVSTLIDRVGPEGVRSHRILFEAFQRYLDLLEDSSDSENRQSAIQHSDSILRPTSNIEYLKDYRILGEIDRGNNGTVHRASALGGSAQGDLAIKIYRLYKHSTGMTVAAQRLAKEQYQSEVLHKNIVRIYSAGYADYQQHSHVPFIVMEQVPGMNLKKWMIKNTLGSPLNVVTALEIIAQMTDAVEAVHGAGLLHRDFKPSNILGCEEGTLIVSKLKLGDFGSACRAIEVAHEAQRLGTPGYMSPEQVRGGESFASDIFSMGVTLLVLISGRMVGAKNPDTALITPENQAVIDEVYRYVERRSQLSPAQIDDLASRYQDIFAPALLNRVVPLGRNLREKMQYRGVKAIIQRCLEPVPEQRYHSAKNLRDDLNAVLRDQPMPACEYSFGECMRLFSLRCRREGSEYEDDRRCGWGIAFFIFAVISLCGEILDHILRCLGYSVEDSNDLCNIVTIPPILLVAALTWRRMHDTSIVQSAGKIVAMYVICGTLLIIRSSYTYEPMHNLTEQLLILFTFAISAIAVLNGPWRFTRLLGYSTMALALPILSISHHYPDILDRWGPNLMGWLYIVMLFLMAYGHISLVHLRSMRILPLFGRSFNSEQKSELISR